MSDRAARLRADALAELEDELSRREAAAEAARRTAAEAIARAEAAEAALAPLHRRVEELERHIDAIEHTLAWRWLQRPRRLYGAARRAIKR